MIDIHDYESMRFYGSTINYHVIILTAAVCYPYERT